MFKGIPIDGSLSSFTAMMKAKGFICSGTEKDAAYYSGKFAGASDCSVSAVCNDEKNVTSVIVLFPKVEDWSSLVTRYNTLKEMLTKKYGEPEVSHEYFQGFWSDTDGDGMKMTALADDACKYETLYETEKGAIELYISHNKGDYRRGFVVLRYFDKINYAQKESEVYDDL